MCMCMCKVSQRFIRVPLLHGILTLARPIYELPDDGRKDRNMQNHFNVNFKYILVFSKPNIYVHHSVNINICIKMHGKKET
jgi:hypothetical protein